MKGRCDIVWYSGAFVAGSVAAGLFRGPFPGAVLILLVILIIALAAFTALFRRSFTAVAAFLLLGAVSGMVGGCGPDGELRRRAESFKAEASSALSRIAGGGREGAILSAIAIGDRSGIDRTLKNDFRSSGAMHLIALSGLHIGVLYFFLTLTFALLGNSPPCRVIRKILILAILWAYAFVSGLSNSILRAVIMISVYEAGELFGSERDLLRALAISAFITTLCQPTAPFQIGFQLSYGAMASIYFIYPQVKRLLECRSALLEKVWNTVALSLSCQAATAPLVLLYFGTFPKYFMIPNFVAIPLTSAAIYLTPVALITENLPVAGDFLAAVLHLSLKALRTAISIIAGL